MNRDDRTPCEDCGDPDCLANLPEGEIADEVSCLETQLRQERRRGDDTTPAAADADHVPPADTHGQVGQAAPGAAAPKPGPPDSPSLAIGTPTAPQPDAGKPPDVYELAIELGVDHNAGAVVLGFGVSVRTLRLPAEHAELLGRLVRKPGGPPGPCISFGFGRDGRLCA